MLIVLAALENAWNVIQTILGIGGLIFVHELGHFLVGRWCGVRAEVFSIGFGPAIAKWKPGKTEYRLAPVPLGGYVKFLGENPEDRETAPDSFHAATYPRKAAIMLAGVTMNVITAFALFAWTFSTGVELTAPKVGQMSHGMPAWAAGLESGDEILSVDGDDVLEFGDIANDVGLRDVVTLVVRRNGEILPPIVVRTAETTGGIRQLGFAPPLIEDGILRPAEDSVADRAGFIAGDRVVAVNGAPETSVQAVFETWVTGQGCQVSVERDGERLDIELPYATETAHRIGVAADALAIGVLRQRGAAQKAGLAVGDVPTALDGEPIPSVGVLLERLVAEGASPRELTVMRDGAAVTIPIGDDPVAFATSVSTSAVGALYVRPHTADGSESPAAAAGIVPGTLILTADGRAVESIGDLGAAVAAAREDDRAVDVTFRLPDGTEKSAAIRAIAIDGPGDPGFLSAAETHIVKADGLLDAVMYGIDRTDRWVHRILRTLGSLVTGRVSATNLQGPVAIARMSYHEAKSGTGKYLLFLGMISMNLAVLNLLPIPMLDGGQLAMITAEKIRGRPLPESLQAGLQWAGLIMLLSLMVFVVANDLRNL